MKDLSISQSYFLCTVNEKGKFSAFSTEVPVCMLAGALLDLIFEGYVTIGDDKKLAITAALPTEYQYLSHLYNTIQDSKPMKVEKLASIYAMSFSDKRIKALMADIGHSLAGLGCVTPEGACFLPDPKAVDTMIQRIRAELLEEGNISDNILGLSYLMERSHQLKKYFSPYEKDRLKARLKEMKKDPANKLVAQMVDYIEEMLTVIIVTAAT